MDVVAVKSAVTKSAPVPSADETGSIKRIVPTMIAPRKLSGIICSDLILFFTYFFLHVLSDNVIRTGNTSSLPAIISNIRTHFESRLNAE